MEEVSASVRGALARGCRPQMASLNFGRGVNKAASEILLLTFFNSLAGGGSESLRHISLGWDIPFTEAVVHAVASAAPLLSSLKMTTIKSVIYGMQQPLGPKIDSDAAAAVQLLLQLVGPRLGVLDLCSKHLPAWALEPLAQCTALTKLCLRNSWHEMTASPAKTLEEDLSVLRSLSSLTSLRDLTLSLRSEAPSDPAVRHVRAAGLESCLSALTALTSLDISLGCLERSCLLYHPTCVRYGGLDVEEEMTWLQSQGLFEEAAQLLSGVTAEWRALVGPARCMPYLSSLRTPTARAEAADRASLTALTSLTVGAIATPAPLETVGNNHQPTAIVYDLPPLLKQLSVHAPMPLHVASALRQAPSTLAAGEPKIFWKAMAGLPFANRPFWALEFSDGDVDTETRLTAEAIAALHRAVRSLQASFSLEPAYTTYQQEFQGPYLQVFGTRAEVFRPPAAAEPAATGGGGGEGTHCGSWLGWLVAELQPESLKLWRFALSPRDLLGMARCMGGLKVLHLHDCRYNLSALPLLGGLPAVEKLTLCCDDWEWPQEADPAYISTVLQAAFLGLTAPVSRRYGGWAGNHNAADEAMYACKFMLPLPQIQSLSVICKEQSMVEGLVVELEAATAELERRRPRPAILGVEVSW